MFFDGAYRDMGVVPEHLMQAAVTAINGVDEDDYTYRDYNVQELKESWLRIDFARPPEQPNLLPLYNGFQGIAQYVVDSYNLKSISNVSLSRLKPLQVLEEHVDGRFIHKLTDRYLVPLSRSDKNYNYGYYQRQKVEFKLQYGHVYRINNSIIHSALNLENDDRYNLLIDVIDPRVWAKFANHPDLYRSLNVLSVNWKFEERLRVKQQHNLK